VLEQGVSCITASDTRWTRCDIKSVALLANVLLRQQAIDANANETILLRDGQLTEASASSVCVVIDGAIRYPPQTPRLLPGTTRGLIHELAAAAGISFTFVPVSERELRGADEIWLTAATRGAVAVTRLDGAPVGDARPGPLWRRMHALIEDFWLR
jgi:D-alanine transaminase